MNAILPQVQESVDYIREHSHGNPSLAVVLGSGLGQFAEELDNQMAIPTSSIPHYPLSTVEGHKGRIVLGYCSGKSLVAFQGRIHFYESGNLDVVLYPVHVAYALGIRTLIVTNAAGGVNRSFSAGDLMLITDQLNLTLQRHGGFNSSRLPVYDSGLFQLAIEAASESGILLRQGVYAGVKGPSYETAAEVEMIHRVGADAVGMSTVFEASLASSLGMKVLGISCITNLATGIASSKLSHEEVTEVGNRVRSRFAHLLQLIIARVQPTTP